MSNQGFTGISFPFRFSSRGGVATSTANLHDITHIKESIEQIVLTDKDSRVMEVFGSECRDSMFEVSDDEIEMSLLKAKVKDAVEKYETRVTVEGVDVECREDSKGSYYAVDIHIQVKKFLTQHTVTVNIREGGSM